jgi:lipid II:glycine glycyltransferase (peptidoglycan interpeptide bridge formation enzyme)
MITLATGEQLKQWDQLIAANPDGGNVLQAKAFGETKSRHGWQARYMFIEDVAILALVRHIPLLGEYWYIPKGPGAVELKHVQLISKALKETDAFCIKVDPEIIDTGTGLNPLLEAGFIKALRDIQYNIATVVVDLVPGEDEILAAFKQKTRYNIRLAAKKGVEVKPVETTPDTIQQLYEMSRTTYERAGVYVRGKSYFKDFWNLHAQSGTGQMFFAYFDDRPMAGAFITFLGASALYKDGASYRDHPELQAPYLMQWEIMRWLKAKGINAYDLHGVPPKSHIDDASHPLAGLARFKRGFNPEITEFIGTYDLVLKPVQYKLWSQIGERAAMSYETRRRQRLFY